MPIRAIAEVIGRHLDLPVVSIARDKVAEHFGWLARFLAADVPASKRADPTDAGVAADPPGLIDDLEQGHYFHSTVA